MKNMKLFLGGDLDQLSKADAKECAKQERDFVVDQHGILLRVSQGRPDEDGSPGLEFRIVVPTTAQDDLIRLYHNSLEGGHQGANRTYKKLRRSFYWRSMYPSIQKYIEKCTDCETGKGNPKIRAPSTGNVTAMYPFQFIAMDHIPSLPESYKGNTELLIWVCLYTGFVVAKATPNRQATTIAEAYEEAVYRRFGASEGIRHDREPGFMSEAFKEFNRLMGQRSKATLSYRPQANGAAERMVQTLTRAIKMYVKDLGQRDWDDYAEQLCMALNNSYDRIRKETPYYLMHGWDPKTTIESSLAIRGDGDRDAKRWRYRIQRQYQRARAHVNDLLREAQADRAAEANERATEDPIKAGDRVWLYLDRIREGFAPKLAHKWHGPFRVLEVLDGHTCRLETRGSGYGVFPLVHMSKLKICKDLPARPTARLAEGVEERFDFDESLLPEDSFEPDASQGIFEVEEIVSSRVVQPRTRGSKRYTEYQIRWKNFDQLEWVREEDLQCGGLLYDFQAKEKAQNRFDVMQTERDLPETAVTQQNSQGSGPP